MSSIAPSSTSNQSSLTIDTSAYPSAEQGRFARWASVAKAQLRGRTTAGQSLISIIDQAVVSGASFLSAVIVGRALAPAELGHYYMTLTIVLVLVGLQEALVAAPYMVFGARRRGRDLAEFTGSMWVQHFSLTVAGVAFVAAFAIVMANYSSGGLVPGLWTVAFVVPWILFREGIRRYTFARLRSGVALAIDLAVCLVQLSALVALWYFGRLTVPLAFAAIGVASGLACIGWLLSKPERPLVARRRLTDDWRHNWEFSRWTVLSYFTVDTIPFLMPWLIGYAAGAAATGVYGGCATLLGVTNILVHGAGNFMRPKAAHAYVADGVPALRHVLLLTGGVFVSAFGLLCLGFMVTGDLLAVLVFGSDFHGTGSLLTLLAVNVLVGSLGYVAGSGLWALSQPRASMIADACMLAATLAAAWFLIAPYGPVGAALAAVIGTTLGTALKILTVHWMLQQYSRPGSNSLNS